MSESRSSVTGLTDKYNITLFTNIANEYDRKVINKG